MILSNGFVLNVKYFPFHYLADFKKSTILSLSFSVIKALVCICMPTVSQISGEKVEGEGVL